MREEGGSLERGPSAPQPAERANVIPEERSNRRFADAMDRGR